MYRLIFRPIQILWFITFLAIIFSSCQTNQPIPPFSHQDHYRLKGYQNMNPKHRLKMVSEKETGQRILLCGKLIEKENKRIIKKQSLKLFQAADTGKYELTNSKSKSSTRLNGTVMTNHLGMFYMETIVPGDGQPLYLIEQNDRPYLYEIHFAPFTSAINKRFIEKNDQQFLMELKKRKDGVLVGFVVVERLAQ